MSNEEKANTCRLSQIKTTSPVQYQQITENQYYQDVEQQIQKWWQSPRFKNVVRPYTAKQVAALRPSVLFDNQSNYMQRKLWGMLLDARNHDTFHHTYGALDPVQVCNLAKYLTTIYVSGWQCSSTASTTNEPGPDFADYPYNTVPNKVHQLFTALNFHDRKQNEARSRMSSEERKNTLFVDYQRPIIADFDTGFGGTTSIMKLAKLMHESGAAGVHIEDQRCGTKKCGHMAGKVIVSTREHCNRLVSIRLQSDILGNELVIVARTDSLGAKLIDSNIDSIDHPWILGINIIYQKIKGQIDAQNPESLASFPQAGFAAIKRNFSGAEQETKLNEWKSKCYDMSLEDGRAYAKSQGFEFFFDWEACRTPEGFYQCKGSVEFSARRGREFLKYADILWMETDQPNIKVARQFSQLVKQYHPDKFLAYNLSPSFNWSKSGMNDQEISNFCAELGKLGYVWQFITLAGFHMNALASEKFSKDFADRKMISYVETIQREEGKHNVDQLTHQRWSGAELVDKQVTTVSNNSFLSSTNKESTEYQFNTKPKI